MAGKMGEWSEDFLLESIPVGHKRFEQAAVCSSVINQSPSCLFDRAVREDCRAVIQRMSKRHWRVDQVEVELERAKERRCGAERMDRGAEVVPEAWKRQLASSCPTADRVPGLEDENRAAGLSEGDRSSETVRPRADNDRV
jgi:hypothetical protein